MINEALVFSNCLFRFLDFWFAKGNNKFHQGHDRLSMNPKEDMILFLCVSLIYYVNNLMLMQGH